MSISQNSGQNILNLASTLYLLSSVYSYSLWQPSSPIQIFCFFARNARYVVQIQLGSSLHGMFDSCSPRRKDDPRLSDLQECARPSSALFVQAAWILQALTWRVQAEADKINAAGAPVYEPGVYYGGGKQLGPGVYTSPYPGAWKQIRGKSYGELNSLASP